MSSTIHSCLDSLSPYPPVCCDYGIFIHNYTAALGISLSHMHLDLPLPAGSLQKIRSRVFQVVDEIFACGTSVKYGMGGIIGVQEKTLSVITLSLSAHMYMSG